MSAVIQQFCASLYSELIIADIDRKKVFGALIQPYPNQERSPNFWHGIRLALLPKLALPIELPILLRDSNAVHVDHFPLSFFHDGMLITRLDQLVLDLIIGRSRDFQD